MTTLLFSDLDERPYLSDIILDMFQRAGPGRDHAVCGEPQRMGMKPKKEDFDASMGVLFAIEDGHPQAAICICPYSDEQVTLWGPVFKEHIRDDLSHQLLDYVKNALARSNYASYRVMIDTRNRQMRDFYLSCGLQKFEDNILFSRRIEKPADVPRFPVDVAKPNEYSRVFDLLNISFPENGHCSPGIEQRVLEGYTHYVIRINNVIEGCAVISRNQQRSWLSLLCMDVSQRSRGYGHDLLNGIINNEYSKGSQEIAFEVLANNKAALKLYESCGFEKQWTATIFTGPL